MPDPAQLFQSFGFPGTDTPQTSQAVRRQLEALGRLFYTTDPDYPAGPRVGMPRIYNPDGLGIGIKLQWYDGVDWLTLIDGIETTNPLTAQPQFVMYPSDVGLSPGGNSAGADGFDTGLTIGGEPVPNSLFLVYVNGVFVSVGNGTKVGVESYFSVDGGVTARTLANIAQGDTWYWNASTAVYDILTTFKVNFVYMVEA